MSIWENTMNLWRQTNIDKYLYEIIDHYKNSDSEAEKNEIFSSLCSSIWSSTNKRRVYTKQISFTVRKDLKETDIGKIFDTWSEMEYKGYKSVTKETDWCSLIRQKINNLYTRYFDKEVILKRDYLDLLNTPKRLYYQWINGAEITSDELIRIFNDAIDQAEKLKTTYQTQKMNLSWNDYKEIINGFLQKICNNCKLIEDYEDKTKMSSMYDFANEDNFYIHYFCISLEAYMQNFTKEYYGLKRGRNKKYKRCKRCGKLIETTGRNLQYCKICKQKSRLETKRKWWKNNH